MDQPAGFNEERTKGYDDRIVHHIPGYDILHGLAETMLAQELPEKARILVAGAGTGKEILDWAPKHPGWRFTALDPSEPMLELAKKKIAAASLQDRVEFKVGTVNTLPEDAVYDAATLILVFHFVPDKDEKEAILSSIMEHLAPGAPFILATMFGEPESTRLKRLVAASQAWSVSHGIPREKAEESWNLNRKDLYVAPEERVKKLLRGAGFIDIQRIFQALAIGAWMARAPRPNRGDSGAPEENW